MISISSYAKIDLEKGNVVTLVGSGMGSRMVHYGHFETEIFLRFPNANLTIRNICDEGNTPGFRPHPSREQQGQYAFPGANELIHKDLKAETKPKGHFPTPDQWLSSLKTDVVICFFGFNSSFDGPRELNRFKKELSGFLSHTKSMSYGQGNPKVVGTTNAAGVCTVGVLGTGGAPMVHVWLAAHPCGPFAALEGNGAGVDTGTPLRAQRFLQLCIEAKRFYLLPIGIQSPSGFNNRHSQRLRSRNLQCE